MNLGEVKSTPRFDLDALPWVNDQTTLKDRSAVTLGDVSSRLLWGLSVFIQTLVFGWAICVFVRAIWVSLAKCLQGGWFAFWMAFVPLAAIGVFWLSFAYGRSNEYSRGYGLVGYLLGTAIKKQGIERVGHFVDVENGVLAGVIFLGVAAIGSVNLPVGLSGARGVISRSDLVAKVEMLRWLLTVSSILLIAGVVQIGFEYRWVAAQFVDEKDTGKLWEPGAAMASAATLAAGVFLSLVLAAAFVPAAYILKVQIDDHNEINKGPFLQRIKYSLPDLYWVVAKIAGPVLAAAPFASLFKM